MIAADRIPLPAAVAGDERPRTMCLRRIAAALGVDAGPRVVGPASDDLATEARALGLGCRPLDLDGRWWQEDHGPLLATAREDERPLALLPGRLVGYVRHDPSDGSRRSIGRRTADQLSRRAWAFHPILPAEPVTLPALARLLYRASRSDLATFAGAGVCLGLLGAVVPLVVAILLDRILPSGVRGRVLSLAIALTLVLVVAAILRAVQVVAALRLVSRTDAIGLAALWDRILRLPGRFHRDRAGGDVAARMMAFHRLRFRLSGALASGLFGLLFAIFQIPVLVVLGGRLVVVPIVVALAALGASLLVSRPGVTGASASAGSDGRIARLIACVAKIRVAATERQAFAHWAEPFLRDRPAVARGRRRADRIEAFGTHAPLLLLLVLFGAFESLAPAGIATGDAVGFTISFALFLVATLATIRALRGLSGATGDLDRLRPLLEAVPERRVVAGQSFRPTGAIRVDRVTFLYRPDGPPTVEDVSIEIEAGQFLAIVGPSGAGKSTLLRLLLGLERPDKGSVYYDDHDLSGLDLVTVRSQVGAVLQDSALLPGSILSNVEGAMPASIDEVSRALRTADIEVEIRALPMGLHTLVTEGGATFSGGQRQRLLLARAIVRRPPILFLDEATGALDAESQRRILGNLKGLGATIVATATHPGVALLADRIVVLDRGQVVGVGTYTDLAARAGLFRDLVGGSPPDREA